MYLLILSLFWLIDFQKNKIALDASSNCVNWLSNNLASWWLDHHVAATTTTRQSSELAISKKGKTLLITSQICSYIYLVFENITIFLWCVSLKWITASLALHALTPSHCGHNPERIFQFRECATWMFQPIWI